MKTKSLFFVLGILGIGIVVTLYLSLIPSVEGISRYEAIPERPNDFTAYTREVWSGGLSDLCDLPDKYWKQPEFYGKTFENAKESFYDNPDYKMWGVYGQGNIPRQLGYTFENFKKGDEFELCSFFHNGFGVWTYQGFKLVPIENEYFEVIITPDEVTMSPTFPVFEDGWSQKITIKIVAKQTPPVGGYELGFDVEAPSNEYSRQQTKDILKMEIDKEKYMLDCMEFLGSEERCTDLINGREKKYVAGGAYKANVLPLTIGVTIK